MNSIRPLVFSLIVLLFCQTGHCGSLWESFLQNPSMDKYSEIKIAIESESNVCDQNSIPTKVEISTLFKLIQGANPPALRATLLVIKCLGVGDVEDFNRVSGVFLEKLPTIFLQVIRDNDIQDRQLRYMVTMLPLSLVDNLPAKILTLERRIALIAAINNVKLIAIKAKVMAFLQEEKDDLEKINVEIGN